MKLLGTEDILVVTVTGPSSSVFDASYESGLLLRCPFWLPGVPKKLLGP